MTFIYITILLVRQKAFIDQFGSLHLPIGDGGY